MSLEIKVLDVKHHADLLAWLYLKLKLEGRADKIFYQAPHDVVYFLTWVDQLAVFYGGFKDDILVGGGWVGMPSLLEAKEDQAPLCGKTTFRKAEIGFGFSGDCSVFEALQMGRLMLETTFDSYKIDFLFGTTPESNKAALMYARRLGMELIGPTPNTCVFNGKIEGTYTSHLTKELLNASRETRKAKDANQRN